MKPIRKNWVRSGLAFSGLVVALLSVSNSIPPISQKAVAQDQFNAADMQRVVNQYCLACHNDALATSGLSLQTVDFTRIANHAETLEKVVKSQAVTLGRMDENIKAIRDSVEKMANRDTEN